MIGNIFQYLEDNKGKKIPLEYKLLNNIPLNETDLIVNHDLNLFKSKIKSLPNNLTVNGYLDLTLNKIKELPNNLTVKGWLIIHHTKVSRLPEDSHVEGCLWCDYTPLAEIIKHDKSLLTKYKKQVKGTIFYD